MRVLSEGLKLISHGSEVDDEAQANIAGFAASENRFGAGASSSIASRSANVADFAAARAPKGIPMAGSIAAGLPIDAIETTEYLAVESQYASSCFALKVKGESMIEDGIYDGDFVIVKPNPSPLNGDVVVALLDDGNATLKRFFKRKKWLSSAASQQ